VGLPHIVSCRRLLLLPFRDLSSAFLTNFVAVYRRSCRNIVIEILAGKNVVASAEAALVRLLGEAVPITRSKSLVKDEVKKKEKITRRRCHSASRRV
jgi:hypothetical protein